MKKRRCLTKTRSPLYYLGDKYKIINQINQFLPKKIDVFFDIFGGGGTILAAINAKEYFYNDVNKYVTSLINWLYIDAKRKTPKFLKQVILIINKYNLTTSFKTKYIRNTRNELKLRNEEGFYLLRNNYNKLKNKFSEKANIMLFVLLVYSFNSQLRYNSLNEFNTPCGKSDLNIRRIRTFKDFQENIKCKNIKFFSYDFVEFIKREVLSINLGKNAFLYLDPPYFLTCAQYNSFWNIENEKKLLEMLDLLIKKNISWGLSNSIANKGIRNTLLCDWIEKNKTKITIKNIESNFTNSNYQRKGENLHEVYITNVFKKNKNRFKAIKF